MRAQITISVVVIAALAATGCESLRPKESPQAASTAEEDCINGKPDGGPLKVSAPGPGGLDSNPQVQRDPRAAAAVKPDPELESLLGQTRERRLESINRTIYLALRSLDEELRREQRVAACRNPFVLDAGQAQSPPPTGGGVGGANQATGANAPAASSNTTAGGSSPSDANVYAARKASMPSGGSGNGLTAPKTYPGSDNDIVARRLQKAAEDETDPVLRAKLWQEYWDFRQGTAAK